MRYNVGIVGAGSIGALKPDHIDGPNLPLPLTHASAVYHNPNFELKWIDDIDDKKRITAYQKWNTSCGNLLPFAQNTDVIVIATPTETHLKEFEKAIERKPKLIVLEKPAGTNIYDATKIDYLSNQSGIPVFVNYGRRYCPTIMNVIERIIENEEIRHIVFYYTRGFVRDGSHAINMINTLLGRFIDGDIGEYSIDDYSQEDLTYEVKLQYSFGKHAYLIPVDGREYDIFEMQIFTNNARWDFTDHFKNVSCTLRKKEETYGDYFSMPGPSGSYFKTRLEWSLANLYEEIYDYLSSNEYEKFIPCDMKDALKVWKIIDYLQSKKRINDKRKDI